MAACGLCLQIDCPAIKELDGGYVEIDDGICTYHDGAAASPGVVIKTPADVWLAVSRGEMDGQQAFMTGRYKVEGDLGLLLKLKAFFSG